MNNDLTESQGSDTFLMWMLLIISGNPAFYQQDWARIFYILIAVVLFAVYAKRFTIVFYKRIAVYCSLFLFIFFIQYVNLGSIPTSFILGFILKMFIGCCVFAVLGVRFSEVFYRVIYMICLISLPFYMLHIIGGDNVLSTFFLHDSSKSIGLYTFRPQAPIESSLRNSGLFWEPGAFQGYINLCLFFNFYRLPQLIKNNKFSLFIILLAFITTQSTTGFLLFAILVASYILTYTQINKSLALVITAGFLFIGFLLFQSLDFLGAKIQAQFDVAVQSDNDEFDPTRLGSLLFDLHYIAKNPLTGNGFDPKTRYADHPTLITMVEHGENLRHGNGFSNFLASAGILGMFWYLFCVCKFIKTPSIRDPIMLILIIVVLLQGEDFLRFPFFLGIPFYISSQLYD